MDDLDLGATIRSLVAGQKVFGRYTLKKILGRGGMGVVWLARDEELGEDVALKFLPEFLIGDRTAIDDLRREATRARALSHPQIVRINDFLRDERAVAISMEYVAGQSLAEWRAAQPAGIFEVAQLAPWVTQLCDALAYAHGKAKVVHRDLKPANLLITAAGDVKIADFGIARAIGDSVSRVTGRVDGSVHYMSPQHQFGDPPSVGDDIYALGATLYELLTGKPPFHQGSVEAIQAQALGKLAPRMQARREELGVTGDVIPEAWEATIAACLAKEVAARPRGARAVLEALGLAAESGNVPNPQPPWLPEAIVPGREIAGVEAVAAQEQEPLSPEPAPEPAAPTLESPAATLDAAPPIIPDPPIFSVVEQPVAAEPPAHEPVVVAGEPVTEPAEPESPSATPRSTAEPPAKSAWSRLKWRIAVMAALGAVIGAVVGVVMTGRAPESGPAAGVTSRGAAVDLPPSRAVTPVPVAPALEPVASPTPTPAPAPVTAQEPAPAKNVDVAADARLEVKTIPSGADVAIKDLGQGQSPWVLPAVKPGRYAVTLRREGYEEWSGEVDVAAKAQVELKTTLVRSLGSAVVASEPRGLPFLLTSGERTERGTTPATLTQLPTGNYALTVSRQGWPDVKQTVTVRRGEQASGRAEFIGGGLEIQSVPAGAQVLRGGQFLGTTPLALRELGPGNFELELRATGYGPTKWAGEVKAGETTRATITLVRTEGR